jgi:hypothetical protein
LRLGCKTVSSLTGMPRRFITRAPGCRCCNQEGEQFQLPDVSGMRSEKCISGDRSGQHHTD